MTTNAYNLQKAINQTIADKVALAFDEEIGGKWHTAILKAAQEIKENPTVNFDGEILRFVSRDSGKARMVTKSGCVKNACDCTDSISYHKALFAILTKYTLLQNEFIGCRVCEQRFQRDMENCTKVLAEAEKVLESSAKVSAEISEARKARGLSEFNLSPYFSGGNSREGKITRIGNVRI